MFRRTSNVAFLVSCSVLAGACCSSLSRDLAGCSATRSSLERERAGLVREVEEAHNARKDATQELTLVTAQLASVREELRTLQGRLDDSEARRLQLEHSSVGILSDQLATCRKESASDAVACRTEATRASATARSLCDREVSAAQYTGRLEGANRVLASIQVAGTAEKVSGLIFDDYYYSFQVRVGESSFVAFRVQTKKEESGFGSALSAIRGLVPAVLALVPK